MRRDVGGVAVSERGRLERAARLVEAAARRRDVRDAARRRPHVRAVAGERLARSARELDRVVVAHVDERAEQLAARDGGGGHERRPPGLARAPSRAGPRRRTGTPSRRRSRPPARISRTARGGRAAHRPRGARRAPPRGRRRRAGARSRVTMRSRISSSATAIAPWRAAKRSKSASGPDSRITASQARGTPCPRAGTGTTSERSPTSASSGANGARRALRGPAGKLHAERLDRPVGRDGGALPALGDDPAARRRARSRRLRPRRRPRRAARRGRDPRARAARGARAARCRARAPSTAR